jgi:hypothetical protein
LAASLFQPPQDKKGEFFIESPQKIFAFLMAYGPTPDELVAWMGNPDEYAQRTVDAEPAVEFPNGEGRAADRRGSANDGDTGAVRQSRIENGILAGQVLPQDARNALNGGLQAFIAVRRR